MPPILKDDLFAAIRRDSGAGTSVRSGQVPDRRANDGANETRRDGPDRLVTQRAADPRPAVGLSWLILPLAGLSRRRR